MSREEWPSLFRATSGRQALLVLEFGGQGFSYFSELNTIVDENPCVAHLFERAAADLAVLASHEDVHSQLDHGFDLFAWMKTPPPNEYLERAPMAFPLIGLTQMLMYYVTLKRAGISPAETREVCSGALGHSSGVCAATVAAAATSFDHLEALILDCTRYLFWHGVRCQQETPTHSVDPSLTKNSEKPSPMLSVRGLLVKHVEKVVDNCNEALASDRKLRKPITIGLVNGPDAAVVVGDEETLQIFATTLQHQFPAAKDSNSHVPYSERKCSPILEYLKVTTPFHSPFISKAVPKIIEDASVSSPLFSALSGKDLAFPVFSTVDGSDIRESEGSLLPDLVRMQVEQPLDWRKATRSVGHTPTIIADFGPGGKKGVAAISSRCLGGRSVSFVHASPNGKVTSLYPHADLLVRVDATISVPTFWEDKYSPRVARVQDDIVTGNRCGGCICLTWSCVSSYATRTLDSMLGMSSMPQCDRWPAPLLRQSLSGHLTEEVACERKAPTANAEATTTSKAEDIQKIVLNTIAGLLGCAADEIPLDEAFSTFGMTSMMSVDMSKRLGQALSCQLPATLAFDLVNVDRLCEYLHARLRPRPDTRPLDHASQLARGISHTDGLRSPAEAWVDGVACVLPGGQGHSLTNWAQLWQILVRGQDCVSSPPAGRPSAVARKGRCTSESPGYSQAGYLDADTLMMFDAASFGMSMAEAEITDPQQRLCLSVAREALEDAQARTHAAADIGVFVGVTHVDFVSLVKPKSKKMSPSAYTGTSLTTAICANRISYAFNLRGPSVSCDSASSSSIVTTDLAFQALQSGRCTSAISLGVNVNIDPFWTEAFMSAQMLSASGRCRFGDDAADGYVRGEGCAGLLLRIRRGEDAILPDPYANLVSSAINQDGRSNGLTAPNPTQQESLLRQAWRSASCADSSAKYIEAHGTGTFLGDPIEISAMDRALRESKFEEMPVLRTTSLKSNIGHLECGAGAASSLKLALILRQAIMPISLHCHVPNRNIDWSGVSVVSEIEQIISRGAVDRNLPCGGVSGFGFGGTNGHIVMRTHQQRCESGPLHRTRLSPRGLSPVFCWPVVSEVEIIGDGDSSVEEPSCVLAVCALEQPSTALTAEVPTDTQEDLHAEIRRLHAQVAELTAKLGLKEQRIQVLERSTICSRCGATNPEGVLASPQSAAIQQQASLNDEDGALKIQADNETKLQEIVIHAVHAIMPSLSAQNLDIDIDLIEEGLDSLSAIELSHRLNAALPKGSLISSTQLLKEPTVRAMVRLVGQLVNPSLASVLGTANIEEESKAFPTCALQRGMLFHQMTSERPDMFLETICLEVSGPLDVAAFRKAWTRLVPLVPQLRARFDAFTSGAAMQSIMEASVCSDRDTFFSVHEMWNSGIDEVHQFVLQDRRHGIRIDDAPLLRVNLLLLQAEVCYVVVTIHHLIIDGWSWRVLFQILQQEYGAALVGDDMCVSKMQQNVPSFRSIVEYEDSADSTSAKRYWSKMLQGASNVQPFAQTTCKVDVLRCSFSLSVTEGAMIRAFASRCGITMAALIRAAWYLVHSSKSFCGKDDVIFGYTASRRTMPVPDIQRIVGPVVNTLPACVHATGSTKIIDFVQDVHQLLLQNADHEWLPLAVIQELVGNRRLFDVIVDVQQDSLYSCRLGPKTTMQHKELIDCVGSPLSIRFILKQDGSISGSAVSESSEFDFQFLDAISRGVRLALCEMAGPTTDRKNVDSLREAIVHEMGPVRAAPAEDHELYPPELPLFAVAGPSQIFRSQGSLPDCQLSRDDLLGAFAAALDQWSSGASHFLIWASSSDGRGYEWVRCAVDRRARAGLNNILPITTEVVRDSARPVVTFSSGRGQSLHQMQVDRTASRLFCFNAAGSSAAQFAALGQELKSHTQVELIAVELPGHGARRNEEALTAMEDIVNLVISEHGDSIATAHTGGGYMLLGVSFGALVAFEVACRMTQQGLPPTQLLVASQAAPTCAHLELDLNLKDADLVCALEERGWLNSEFVQSQVDVWQTVLPVMRADFVAEKAYLLMKQRSSSKSTPLSCQVRIFVGSEDTGLLQDADRTLNVWRDVTNGLSTQCVVPDTGHGFLDTSSGRTAMKQALLGDRPDVSSVVAHLGVQGDQWALVGDAGLVPEIVLKGIAGSFAKMLDALRAGGSQLVSEVLQCSWRAEPMSEPTSLPTQLLHDAFVDRKLETSQEVAIIDDGAVGSERKLTYDNVEQMSGNVALKLLSAGARCQDRVALVSGKGWPQLVGAIGILRSGAAYLPIDPRQVPRERAEMLLKLASVCAVVTDERSLSEFDWLAEVELPVVVSGRLDAPSDEVLHSLLHVRSRCKPEDSAYILYTSGSTGVPKGVNCHHQGAINTCLDLVQRFAISADDRVLALSSFSFDLSVYDLFGSAMAGGTVVVPHPEAISPPDPGAWLATVQQERVTLINAVPAFLELLVGYCETTSSKLPESLRLVWMSGDWVPLSLPQRIRRLAEGQVTVVVLGGATEAAIWSNMYIVPEGLPSGWKSIPYGRPLGNQSMYVLDERSELLEHTAPWVAGMIYIGGAGVALGYLGDDAKTAASFILHPVTGERIYRTGDLGRLRPGDTEELLIEILGREDSQVKLNGFRIELGEVEAEVSAFEAVEESCASVIHARGGPLLAAFFRGPDVDAALLQEHLAQRLPSQLVPKVLFRVDDRFPLNSNGKVDRKKLAEMHADALANLASASTGVVAAVGDSELRIAEAVAEVLSISVQDVCVETNLFSVGLNSLGSMRLVVAALSRGFQLNVRDIFAQPTIRALASASHSSDASLQSVASTTMFCIGDSADESSSPFPLIGITKAYWTGLWSNPYCPEGCRPQIAFEFEWEAGCIDVERLERCFDKFVQRNPAFRAIVLQDSPSMRFLEAHEVTPIKFKVHQVQKEEDVKEQCDQAYRDIFDTAIDPFTFPLLQGCVVHLPNGRGSRFYYCVSLFVMDGITDLTWRLHISKLYRGEALPTPPSLTYKAYNEGYVDGATGIQKAAKWQAAHDFWMKKIDAGLPLPPQLPVRRECPANRGNFSDEGTAPISAAQFENIKLAAARFGVTPTAILLMLYCVCLGRHATSSKMLINVLHCLRHPVHKDYDRVLGNFSSSFLCPIDVGLSGCARPRSLLQLARAVMDALAECQTYNTISGVDVMSLINSRQAAFGQAAAPYVFVSALGLEDSLQDWQALCFREVRVIESTSGTYMVHAIKEYPDGSMYSGFNVVDGAFEPEIVEALVNDHRHLLEAITMRGQGDGIWHRSPDEILAELPVPEPLGAAPAATPGELLHSRLADHAAQMPSDVAVVEAEVGVQLSYRGYLGAVMAVRHCLISCGASDAFARCGAPLVAVICEKSWQQIVAVLGILSAECAYLPINVVAWPRNRIESVLEAGDVVALVTSNSTFARLPWLSALHQPLLNVDQAVCGGDKVASGIAAVCEDSKLHKRSSEDRIAYCIFTSGSTGQPKGVALSHKAALNTIRALADLHQLGSDTVVLGLSQLSFDLSVSDIFMTLRIGGTLVVPPDSSLSPPSPAQWRGMCEKHGVTLWNSVPALFGLLCEESHHTGSMLPRSLQRIWLSGDVIPEKLPASARAVARQQLQIFAMGGATEAGIWSNSTDISNHHPRDGAVPYGNALPGQRMKVVRLEDLKTAAVGVSGMLVISGDSLMMGYYNDEHTTSKALVQIDGERCYLTQDAGYTRRRSDGSLECMITGRIHGEDGGYVKVRGFRVELHEVEAVLGSHSAINTSVVAMHEGDLAAYVVLNPEAVLPSEDCCSPSKSYQSWDALKQDLRNAMVASLPVYAQPRWIHVLDALPLSSNGKLDRAALPVPMDSTKHDMADDAEVNCEVEAGVLAAARELGIPVKSRDDNIFSAGADSVAGLRLIFKLEAAYRVKINAGQLFSDGRISSIATAITHGSSSVEGPVQEAVLNLATFHASSIQMPQGKCLPLFLCHGAGTTALALSALVAALDEVAVFGQIYGISDSFLTSSSDTFNFNSIEDVATSMADLVVRAWPREDAGRASEVALGGWSYGGVVAFACARILEARGLPVRLVLMLDAPIGQKEGCQLDDQAQAELVASASGEVATRIAAHFEACNTLLSQFVPACGKPVKAHVLDIRPVRSQVDFMSDSDRSMLAQSWCRVFIDGADHFSLVQTPFAEDVAKRVLSGIALG